MTDLCRCGCAMQWVDGCGWLCPHCDDEPTAPPRTAATMAESDHDPEPWEFPDDDRYPLAWVYDDGGRDAVAPKADDELGDCVTCAIAIADRRPYAEVYDMVDKFGRAAGYLGIACLGVPHGLTKELMSEITGWRWVPLYNAALVTGDLPDEFRLIAVMPNHMCAVIDGVIHDVRDCAWEDDEYEQFARVEGVYLPPGNDSGAAELNSRSGDVRVERHDKPSDATPCGKSNGSARAKEPLNRLSIEDRMRGTKELLSHEHSART